MAAEAKALARLEVAAALAEPGWAGQLRGVRLQRLSIPTHADVIEVVGAAGADLDVVVLPKVTDVSHVAGPWISTTRCWSSPTVGRSGGSGSTPRSRTAEQRGRHRRIRVDALVLGPADLMASLNMRTLVVGEQLDGDVGDAYHHILMTILVARPAGRWATFDGPYLKVRDVAFRWPRARRRSATMANGCCTPTRSPRVSRSSAPGRRTGATTPS